MNSADLPFLRRHNPQDCIAFAESGSRSLADLRSDVAAVGQQLPEAILGSQIAVICADRYHFAVALLAAWARGHGVALPPNGQAQTIAQLLNRPEVIDLVHDTDGQSGRDLRPWLGHKALSAAGGAFAWPSDRAVATVYSSGTTGDFTPNAKSAQQIGAEIAVLADTFVLQTGQRFVATVPAHHLYGLLFSVLLPLYTGGSFLRATPLHAPTIARQVAQHGVTVMVSVPAHLHSFSALEPDSLPSLSRVFCSTAPLGQATLLDLQNRQHLNITELFGSTETGGIAYRQRPMLSVWQPLAGVEVRVGENQELLVDSAYLAADSPRPLATGDRIDLHADGTFSHLGRSDGVVKVGGKRVALLHIQNKLMELSGVLDAGVIDVAAHSHARGRDILAAVVAKGWTAEKLRSALSESFDPSILPRNIKFVDELPREATGKLRRQRVLDLFGRSDSEPTLPKQLQWLSYEKPSDQAGVHVFLLRVPENLYYFQGHFPNKPILPGVAELFLAVLPQIASLRPQWTAPREIVRLKFRQTIHPLDRLELRIELHDHKLAADFELLRAGLACASGHLKFQVRT